jgi:hypothetical protein
MGRLRREAYGLLGGFCVIRVVWRANLFFLSFWGWGSEENR